MKRQQGMRVLASIILLVTLSILTTRTPALSITSSRYAPDIDALLLEHGYERNIITIRDKHGLRASQQSYTNSVWTRDLDYAISGYSYVLDDMQVLRESIELFLVRIGDDGVVPETIYLREGRIDFENRQSWDSMPNLIHAVYTYVAKTGDGALYRSYRNELQRVGGWIIRLDTNGDSLPDSLEYPYGYYDSLYNSVRHTYALAKFYTALRELAELERYNGSDGASWDQYAESLRAGFHRPFHEGGYWLDDQVWPIAWRRDDDTPVTVLETYGVFEALRSGLIALSDGKRYDNLITALHTYMPEFISGPTPMRLALGGYPLDVRREVDPPVPIWMMDASAPWIVGLAVPGYAAAGYPEDALDVLNAYEAMAQRTNPPVLEFAAGPHTCYGAGNSGDGGRTWDSAAWFMAVYGGHYGLTMTPAELVVQPHPLRTIADDGITNFMYQGARVQLSLDATSQTYRIVSDKPVAVRLRPMGSATSLRLNDGSLQHEVALTLTADTDYVVVSEGDDEDTRSSSRAADMRYPAGGYYNCQGMQSLWQRTDQPIALDVAGLQPRSWMWGPQPITGGIREPFAEGPGGTRLVQYYDKSRMEINDPDANRDQWYVTNGLLVVEMITGKMQTGNQQFVSRQPADVPVAGDSAAINPDAPTYRSFQRVSYPLVTDLVPDRRGDVVIDVLAKNGRVSHDSRMSRYNVVLQGYDDALGHNIPDVFMDFFTQEGLVYETGSYVQAPLMNWVFVMGRPISEPYWAVVAVGGKEKDVLIQAFERRMITYTPDNAPNWRVEMGNVGQHYLQWRYGE